MKLRIAQVAPLYESVPPKLYGGTERVVSFITEELVAMGHEVTLFASGDSKTSSTLIPVCETAIRLNDKSVDPIASHVLQLQLVHEMRERFDVIHFHTDYLHFPMSSLADYTHLTTLHGRLNIPELKPLYKKFSDVPVVSISLNQRKPLLNANWVGNVYHGLPLDLFKPNYSKGNYLAFLGRISPEKGVENAIKMAKISGVPLKIAAKIDKADQEYFNSIKSEFDHPLIEFVGEVDEKQKEVFLGNAIALLFPIVWPEPFGLVMAESLACGTPVIAYRNGSVPEVIQDGTNGFIVSTVREGVDAIGKIDRIRREKCRRTFEERFSAGIMAQSYETLYRQQLNVNGAYELKIISA
jgi:glycosyltransferase involved in cell wall biosynthesis